MSRPLILISPDNALADSPVQITLSGFEPGQTVLLRAHMRDDLNRLWLSHAEFAVSPSGTVNLLTDPPLSGTYSGADPMGLLWSMGLDAAEGELSRFVKSSLQPILITFTALVGWEPVATATLQRTYIAPGVVRLPVQDSDLVATFFHPADGKPHRATIVLGGADSGKYEGVASRLASHGFSALSLAYFGVDHLSPTLANVPLEYFKAALLWMRARPEVLPGGVSLVGWSRGGEAALLIGSIYPQFVRSVVAYVPSGFVTIGASRGIPDFANPQSSWSFGGRPLPFLPMPPNSADAAATAKGEGVSLAPLYTAALNNHDTAARAAIPVERLNGSVLLISAECDAMWPSTRLCDMVMERLKKANHPHPRTHLAYPQAGHTIGVPYRPTTVTHHRTPEGALLEFGGTAHGNAFAESDSWPRVLSFLR